MVVIVGGGCGKCSSRWCIVVMIVGGGCGKCGWWCIVVVIVGGDVVNVVGDAWWY